MDHDWLIHLNQQTVVLVPTRSLANALQQQVAQYNLQQNRTVWEAPNIMLWQDYLQKLWQYNKAQSEQDNPAQNQLTKETQETRKKNIDPYSCLCLSAAQSSLIMHRVIDASRRKEDELTLLNVQQTAKAVQRSWRTMHDWGVGVEQITSQQDLDSQQFSYWISAYQAELNKGRFIDDVSMTDYLINQQCAIPFEKIIYYSYDLITHAQRQLIEIAVQQNIYVEYIDGQQDAQLSYQKASEPKQEIRSALIQARTLIEQQPDLKLGIVIPELQQKTVQVQALAKEVFYPSETPLELLNKEKVYRFSLGQPLQQWPAIRLALSLLGLLKDHFSLSEWASILRNQQLPIYQQHPQTCIQFIDYLQTQRIQRLSLERLQSQYDLLKQKQVNFDSSEALGKLLLDLAEQHQQMQQRIEQQNNQYKTLSFEQWVEVFDSWLLAWGWGQQQLESVQYQLHQRWAKLLLEFAKLQQVQHSLGLARAMDILTEHSKDAVFQAQAVESPLLISGVYEAIGQEFDQCWLTGMTDAYPAPAKKDAFISSDLLAEQGYPQAKPISSFTQAQKVITSLLSHVKKAVISYSVTDDSKQVTHWPSAIFPKVNFVELSQSANNELVSNIPRIALQTYTDTNGGAWSIDNAQGARSPKGGASLFENQSNCEFKAFIQHRIGITREQQEELGLDALERGNIVHALLDYAWQKLGSSRVLKQTVEQGQLTQFINGAVQHVLHNSDDKLSLDQRVLLQHEDQRLAALLAEWLEIELTRPSDFVVQEREQAYPSHLAGIDFLMRIDRLDQLEDGRQLLVDYKTGAAQRSDWMDERIKKPQLPLYATALTDQHNKKIAGIAYGKIKRYESAYIGLSEEGFLSYYRSADEAKQAQIWLEKQSQWRSTLSKLAEDFLAGEAKVNPIERQTCDYCQLHSVCRVSQLRLQTTDEMTPELAIPKPKEPGL